MWTGSAVPGYDVPGYDVPGYDVPGYDVPGYDVPGNDVPGYDVLGYERNPEIPQPGEHAGINVSVVNNLSIHFLFCIFTYIFFNDLM